MLQAGRSETTLPQNQLTAVLQLISPSTFGRPICSSCSQAPGLAEHRGRPRGLEMDKSLPGNCQVCGAAFPCPPRSRQGSSQSFIPSPSSASWGQCWSSLLSSRHKAEWELCSPAGKSPEPSPGELQGSGCPGQHRLHELRAPFHSSLL